MPRNSLKSREGKRQEMVVALQTLSDQMHENYQIEIGIKILAEAVIFILEGQ